MEMTEYITMNDWQRLKYFLNNCGHDDITYELGHTYIRIYEPEMTCSIVYRFDENGKVVSIE